MRGKLQKAGEELTKKNEVPTEQKLLGVLQEMSRSARSAEDKADIATARERIVASFKQGNLQNGFGILTLLSVVIFIFIFILIFVSHYISVCNTIQYKDSRKKRSKHRRSKLIVCNLYGNFGSERFTRLCMGIYQVFQNGRICAEMLK